MRISLRRAVRWAAIVAVILFLNFVMFAQFDGSSNPPAAELGESLGDRSYGRQAKGVVRKPVDNGLADSIVETLFRRRQRSAQWVSDESRKAANKLPGDALRGANSPSKTSTRSPKKLNKHRPTELSDVFISVKTTSKFHDTRVKLLLKTWVLLAREQTYFFTDSDDPTLKKELGSHMINTNCTALHNRQALCCKMAVEYDSFLESGKRWFCHMDDDTYLNVPQLVKMLQNYNHTGDWYLGKPSLKHPMEVSDRTHARQKIAFWFATGGAGMCISRGLALKMMPHASGGRLMTVGEKIRLPDDCTLGYIISQMVRKELTVVQGFHSHLEALWLLKPHTLRDQITFSYSSSQDRKNVVNVEGFSSERDPTRLWSIHCYLFPTFRECLELHH